MEEAEKLRKDNMRILLYGIGKDLEDIEIKIKNKHEIIGYTDSFARLKKYKGKLFYELCTIKKLDFDYLIITLKNRKIAWEIQEMLTGIYGIPLDKIIPFYVYTNRELWNIKMNNYELEKVQGLIFGNSLAATGFLEKELDIPFVNLAVSSQDLYYCYQVFCQCIKQYGERFDSLKYIVIDLYNYMVFNLDTSRGKDILGYMYSGGIQDEHNFKDNKNYSNTLENEMFRNYNVILKDQKQDLMQEVFSNWDTEFEQSSYNRWSHITKYTTLRAEQIIGKSIIQRFEDTFQENRNIFEHFMKNIRKFNGDMKIIFTLIPQYIMMEKVSKPFMDDWKDEFYYIINDICERYHSVFWNFKNCKEISENPMFYYDEMHLNTVGARAISAILNEKLNCI